MSDEIVGHNGEVDLLQQALAGANGVLSDSSTLPETETLDQNELLNILQSDHTSQTIQITAEQAAALGLHIVEPDNILEPELRNDESSNPILEVDEIPVKIQNETNHIPALTVPIVFTNESLSDQTTINNILKKLNYSVSDSSPLGTAKNPIKLVKKGGVFQSLQELTPQQLQQLQRSIPLKKISKNRINSQCVTNHDTNTQVVYRVVYPEEVDLQVPHRGRPGKRGRPRKRKTASASSLSIPVLRPMRTRSGRLTKPPGYKLKNFKQIGEIEESDTENSEVKKIEHQNHDQKDVVKTDDNKSTEQQINQQKLHTGVQMMKRNIPAQFRCPTCNKAYLGYSKIENHIRQHPDHGPIPPKPKPTLLWDTALRISRTQLTGNRAQTFLHELAHLTKNVQRVAPKLLSHCGQGANFEVDDSLSGLLGVPPGIYSINEHAMEEIIKSEKNKKTENHEIDSSYLSQNGGECLQEQLLNVQISHGDENDESHELMLPMVDTGQVPMVLDTSASSDEVMNVDQLVSERFQSFTNGDLPTAPSQPPPSSSNSSLSLDLSLDLFQFHSS